MNIKNIIKVWLGVREDIEKAKEEARAEAAKELTAEKAAAIKKAEAEVKELHGKIEVLQSKLDEGGRGRVHRN